MIRATLIALSILLSFPAVAETRVPSSQSEIGLGFAPVVKKAAPAVVNIYAKIITAGHSSPMFNDPFFRDFFRGFGHEALVAVCALMIAGQGIVRTGALEPVGRVLTRFWKVSPNCLHAWKRNSTAWLRRH